MPVRNTFVRSLHDLGAAAWFGGSLMGALGGNGAAAQVRDPTDRVAAAGWAKWTPANALAIGAHLVGGAGLLVANSDRAKNQSGVTANTVAKMVITGVAMATTAYSGVLGGKVAHGDGQPAAGATESLADTTSEVAAAQKQLKVLQWVTPVLTAAIVVLGAHQGEQQRGGQVLAGIGSTLTRRAGR